MNAAWALSFCGIDFLVVSFNGILVTEIFHSLQGETSLSGLPFAFIRLTGCNLRCTYCDSAYAFHGGTRMSISDILERIKPYQVKHALITGGEPLLQRNTPDLVEALRDAGYSVSIETHGEVSVAPVAGRARLVMDVKTPSSGMARGGYAKNLSLLQKTDEVKFVISSKEDYRFAKILVQSGIIPTEEILFSPALPHANSPGHFEGVPARWLAEKILEDRLSVRFQMQLHKSIWGSETRGV
ncbi:MAG: radical SAM protein [Bdellovibrionota bacterium]